MRQSPSSALPDLRQAQRLSAAISFAGAASAAVIAVRTHASAPLCGIAHCPACYVAAGLAAFGLALLMVRPARVTP